jgi:hypothetical protein
MDSAMSKAYITKFLNVADCIVAAELSHSSFLVFLAPRPQDLPFFYSHTITMRDLDSRCVSINSQGLKGPIFKLQWAIGYTVVDIWS